MDKPYNVCIVGYGFMGSTHASAWRLTGKAEVKAFIGRNLDRAREVASKYSARTYSTLSEALEKEEVDIVDICTPTYTHRDFTVEAAEAGKHILCEKPIALTLEDADEMIRASEKADVKFMVAHCLRFFAEYAKVKELVENGAIGDPVISRALRAGPLPTWGTWFSDQSKSGGVAVDLAIHDIDFLRWCYRDEVERVYASVGRLVRSDLGMDDHALILLRFRGGGIAHVEASWAVPQQYPFTMMMEIAGTKGIISMDNHSTVPVKVVKDDSTQAYAPDTLPWIPGIPFPIDPYYREILHFLECIEADKKPLTDGLEAKKALAVALAARESSRKGEPVTPELHG
ncbi:MAG: Gfo/Idh/MocA family oxidoreductase [Candidatus Bathyarchaeia archaeon]